MNITDPTTIVILTLATLFLGLVCYALGHASARASAKHIEKRTWTQAEHFYRQRAQQAANDPFEGDFH